jgi:hypothetical protein
LTLNRQTSWHTRGPTQPLTTQASAARADFKVSEERQFIGPVAATTWPCIRGRFGTIDMTTGEIARPFQHWQRGRGMAPIACGNRPRGHPPCESQMYKLDRAAACPDAIDRYSKKTAYLLLYRWCKAGYHQEDGRRRAVGKLLLRSALLLPSNDRYPRHNVTR